MNYLKKIIIKNFWGIAQYEHEFNPNQNIIRAKSGMGKSSISLADEWIKNLDVDFEPNIRGKKIIGLETSVKEIYAKNGKEHSFEKTAKQLYKPKQGEVDIKVFDKYEYKYLFDDCALKPSDYEKKLVEFFETDDHIELQILSRNKFFNSNNGAKWGKEKRQQYLFKIFDYQNKVVAMTKEYELIADDILESNLKEEDIKNNINRIIKNVNSAQSENNVTIKNKNDEKAEMLLIDFENLKVKKEELQTEIARMQSEKIDTTAATEICNKYIKLNSIKAKIDEIKQVFQNEMRTYTLTISALKNDIEKTETDIKLCENKIKTLSSDIEDYQIEIEEIEKAEIVFDDTLILKEIERIKKTDYASTDICHNCGQKYPSGIQTEKQKENELARETDLLHENEKLERNKTKRVEFENKKATQLSDLRLKVENALLEQRNPQLRANTLSNTKCVLEGQLKALESKIPTKEEIDYLEAEIKTLQADIDKLRVTENSATLENIIKEKQKEYDNLVEIIGKEKQILKLENDIQSLKEKNNELANVKNEAERKLVQYLEYKKRKNEMVNTEINENFEGIQFNFVEQLGSGSQFGEKENCECLWKKEGGEFGNYSGLSDGEKIVADFILNYNFRKIRKLNFVQFANDLNQRTVNEEQLKNELRLDKVDWQTILLLTDDSKKIATTLIRDMYTEKDCDLGLVQ